MIYQLDIGREISISEIDKHKFTVGIITLEELNENCESLGFLKSSVWECEHNTGRFRSALNIYDDYSFGILNVLNVNDVWGEQDRLGVFIKKNLFLLVDVYDKDESTKLIFEQVTERFSAAPVTMEKFIFSILEKITANDAEALEGIEIELNNLEETAVIGNGGKDFISVMLELKKRLLLIHNYYEQLIDIGEDLQENSNELFNEHNLRYFKIFIRRAERLNNCTLAMRENLVQIREAHQAGMDYSLNSVMKICTVVTSVFLPLTLIVGWYGMNFTSMPEFTWRYGYLWVISLSILVIMLCVWIFKKKKLF